MAQPGGSPRIWLDWNRPGRAAELVATQLNDGNAVFEAVDGVGSRHLTNAGTSQGVDAVVPEPAALALLGFGAATLGVLRRRRGV